MGHSTQNKIGHTGWVKFTYAKGFVLPDWFNSFRGRGGDFTSATNAKMF